MAYLLIFAIALSLFLASFFLYRYGCIQRQHPIVTISVLTAWCFSFLIVFSIPLDVTQTVYRKCIIENNSTQVQNQLDAANAVCQKPWGMIPDEVFPNLWRIIYWASQFLTWLIMPLMQSYLKAGEFTFKGKFKSAVIDNAIYYGSYLLICAVLLIYLALKPGVYLDWQKLKAIASSASNTWGLFLLVLLLGYALVEVPRSLWNNSKPGFTLQYAYFKAAKLSADKTEAEENVEDILESLHAANRAIPAGNELREAIETILRKVPTELLEKTGRNVSRQNDGSPNIVPSLKAMVRLHKQVIKSLQTLQRTEALWGVQVAKIMLLENIARNSASNERIFKREFPEKKHGIKKVLCSPIIEWYWHCLLKSPFLKVLAVVTGILSLMVVWSELTFFNRKPVLSIFANLFNIAKDRYDFLSIELITMTTLCYLCYCAYSTVFRIKFLNLYYLAPHHQTNEHSLIFSGMMLCRLTPPMCLNFLGLIHMDSHIIKTRILETHYTQVMGHMDVLGIISNGFNIYFPMVMLAICLATWFSLGSRTLNAFGFQQFMLNEMISSELVQEGKDLIAREKRRRQRAEEAMQRRRPNENARELTNVSQSKYRAMRSSPGDGLLRDGENVDYSTTNRELDFNRSLTEEINERFGVSTQVSVGFKGYNYNDDDEESDLESMGRRPHNTGLPPRGLFDDV